MSFEGLASTSVVTSSAADARIKAVKSRLSAAFPPDLPLPSGIRNSSDPFVLQSLISHETFMQSDQRIIDIAEDLYTTLDQIDAYAKGGFDRDVLKSLTFKLHRISQDVDFLVSSADIGITMLDSMLTAQKRLDSLTQGSHRNQMMNSSTTTEYLKKAYESRKRWLLGAKQRKDTAMTHVYNLVRLKDHHLMICDPCLLL